jgi:hypothetical protein
LCIHGGTNGLHGLLNEKLAISYEFSCSSDPSSKMWKDTQKTVHEILEEAARLCLEDSKITKESFLKYTSSGTYEEDTKLYLCDLIMTVII